MALTVLVRSGDSKSPPKVTFDAPRVVIGRGEGCDVRLPDPSVSHRHASIRQRGSEYIVIDEGSTNGTFVGPVRLSPHAPRVVRSGDLIRIGRIWLEIKIEHVVPTASPNLATKEIALGLVADALAAQGETACAIVRAASGPDAGRELSITEFERPYVLGRGTGLDLTLEDPDASRRHVEIFRKGGQLFVRDLGSKNGSRLGDKPLESGKDTPWPAKLELALGGNRFVYADPVAEALTELERAADERMREDDSVEPPTAEPFSADAALAHDEAPAETDDDAPVIGETSAAPPVARVPDRAKKKPREVHRGWTMTDVAVALVALAVLALSAVGLLWLFRT